MKNSIEKNNRHVKSVFCETNNYQLEKSIYPLGEDFYCIQTDDNELNNKELLFIKDSNI